MAESRTVYCFYGINLLFLQCSDINLETDYLIRKLYVMIFLFRKNVVLLCLISLNLNSVSGQSRTSLNSAGSGNTGPSTMEFIATATSITFQSINTYTSSNGNNFGIDDIMLEAAVSDISGIVYNDNNGVTGGVDGTPMQNVNISLFSSDGITLISSTTTDANGAYTFSGVESGDYEVHVTPPSGYANVSSTDGTPGDGNTNVSVVDVNVPGVDFGINEPPVNNTISETIADPTGAQIPQGTITANIAGNGPGVGALGNGNTVAITTLPTNGNLFYNGSPVTINTALPNFNPSLLSFTNLQSGTTSTQFSYSFVDAAGLQGTPATFTISWTTALPVKWGFISATQSTNTTVLLKWETLYELNNHGFAIEHSNNGSTWMQIGYKETEAVNGNSNAHLKYTFLHSDPEPGNNYYRLKQTDFDGNYAYSSTCIVKFNIEDQNLSVYPNPSAGDIFIRVSDYSKLVSICITDLSGKMVKRLDVMKRNFNISDLPASVYCLTVLYKNGMTKTIRVQKK